MGNYSILFDYQAFDLQRFGGISHYYYELMKHMNMDYRLLLKYSINYYIQNHEISSHCNVDPQFIYKLFKKNFRNINKEYSALILSKSTQYLFHPTYYNPYFLQNIGKNPFVLTVHDMTHEKFTTYFSPKDYTILWKKELVSKATRIIAISENTKQDIINILNVNPDKIDVVYHGVNIEEKTYSGKKLPWKYILYVGGREGYKNFKHFFTAFCILAQKEDIHLICVGKAFKEEEQQLISASGLKNRIHQMQPTDSELNQLYKDAEMFVYPSWYEGFGMPILEAYANDCPVVLSNTSCFPEIAGKAGLFFDPYHPDAILESMKQILYDNVLKNQLIKLGREQIKKYSWETTAQKTEEIYRKILCL